MKFTIIRKEFLDSGVFGEMILDDKHFCYTAERAYDDNKPKIPDGEYTCKRGMHKLSDLQEFETFEIKGVKGHWGLLFHKGNWAQKDSTGCVLLGTGIGYMLKGGKMLTASKTAFAKFMKALEGVDEFTLVVKSV